MAGGGFHMKLGDDFLDGKREDLPMKGLDILLDVSWLWMGIAHDLFEKVGAGGFGFGHSDRAETFQVTPDPILFVHTEMRSQEAFQEVDAVHGGDIKVALFRPVDT